MACVPHPSACRQRRETWAPGRQGSGQPSGPTARHAAEAAHLARLKAAGSDDYNDEECLSPSALVSPPSGGSGVGRFVRHVGSADVLEGLAHAPPTGQHGRPRYRKVRQQPTHRTARPAPAAENRAQVVHGA